MTENDRIEDASEDERPPDNGDYNLSGLVRLANAGGVSLGVTLLVGGAVVSGLLVGAAEFFEGLADYLDREAGEDAQAFTHGYRSFAKEFRDEIGSDFDQAVDAPYVVTYIHLRDAHVFAPGGGYLPSNAGLFWRGRLESVDGWSIGTLGT